MTWPRLTFLIGMLSALAATPAAPATPAPSGDVATQLVAASWGPEANGAAEVLAAEQMLQLTRAFYTWAGDGAAGAPGNPPLIPDKLDLALLHQSLDAGAAEAAPKLTAALAGLYRAAFTPAQLTELLAFYRSPAGQARLARQEDGARKFEALEQQRAGHPPTHDTSAFDKAVAALRRAGDRETPAELTFDATPTGKALKAKTPALETHLHAAVSAAWPAVSATAEVHYCAKAACGPPERELFRYLGTLFA